MRTRSYILALGLAGTNVLHYGGRRFILGMLLILPCIAHAEWRWELVNSNVQTESGAYSHFIEYNGELYHILIESPSFFLNPTKSVSKSSDGINWTVINSNPPFDSDAHGQVCLFQSSMCLLLTKYSSVDNSRHLILWRTSDGVTWDMVSDNILLPTSQPAGATIFNGNIVALMQVPNTQNYALISSTDGISWDILNNSLPFTSHRPRGLFVLNGQLVAPISKDKIVSNVFYVGLYDIWGSLDGIVWNIEYEFDNQRSGDATAIVFRENLFLLGGNHCAQGRCREYDHIAYSSTGINWKFFNCGNWWYPRAGMEAFTFAGELWISGGVNNGYWLDEIWKFTPYTPSTEGEGTGEGEGEPLPPPVYHSADENKDGAIDLSELLALIQIYNSFAYHCNEFCGFDLGAGVLDCASHSSDYKPADGVISLSELLRFIQIYNAISYSYCPTALPPTEDGFCLVF